MGRLSKTALGLPYVLPRFHHHRHMCRLPVGRRNLPCRRSTPALRRTRVSWCLLVSTTEQAAKMDVADLEYLRCIQPGRSRVHLERPARDKSVVYGQMLSIKSFEL